jgi:CBS-domain-containing membrane protein
MRARDIMTTSVVTTRPDSSIRDIAVLLSRRQFSGLPVVDAEGRLLGIVSEGDLIHHSAIGADPKGKWWLASLSDPDAIARAYSKAHGQTAGDVMVRHVATISDEADLEAVAATLDTHGIKRIPVIRDGRLVGIITRSDLVHALAYANPAGVGARRDNAAVQKEILGKMAEQSWLDASYVNVQVREDIVELGGFIASEDQRQALHVLVREASPSRKLDDKLKIGLPMVSDFM